MINNGWIDANGNIIAVKENISDSAFNFCNKYLPPHVKNILDLYIIKYGNINEIERKKDVYADFLVIVLGFIKISNNKICIPENKYEEYLTKYKKIYDHFGFKEMIYPKLIYNKTTSNFVSYNEKAMLFKKVVEKI